MNKYLEQLIELSAIDKEIDSYEPKIESISRNLNSKKDEANLVDSQISSINNEILGLQEQINQTNLQISSFDAKIKDSKKKSSAIKTEKEMKSLDLEENLAKEQLEAANEEILRLERIIETKKANLEELNAKKSEIDLAVTSLEKEVSKELKEIEKSQVLAYEKKNKLVKDISQKVLTFYEKIRKWAKNTAVVPVKKQACYGCFMKINDKTYSSVLRGEDIITCPHCGRILYKEIQE